jgi:hypothetical protein
LRRMDHRDPAARCTAVMHDRLKGEQSKNVLAAVMKFSPFAIECAKVNGLSIYFRLGPN